MTVNTSKVTGRRKVHFDNLDEVEAEVKRLSAGEVVALGNWDLGQIAWHLAQGIESPLDGPPAFRPPWVVRLVVRTLLRNRFLTRPLPAGFQLPKAGRKLVPGPKVSLEEGLAALDRAVRRWRSEPQRYPNGLLGELTPAEWEQFQCRHAELHLSFLRPA